MDPDSPPSAKTAPAAAPSEGEPNGGEARPLGTPPEPPPGAEMDVPADHGELADDAPRRRRRWAVLRVLLATLALGWWTQHAMRRHFDAGPYTGPVYVYQLGHEENCLIDDNGRILIPEGWEYLGVEAYPNRLIQAHDVTSTWVVDLWGRSAKRERWVGYAVLDTEGRVVRKRAKRWWLSKTGFAEGEEGYMRVDDCGLIRESVRMQRDGKVRQGCQLISRTGQVLRSLDLDVKNKEPLLVCANDDFGLDPERSDRNSRLMLLQDDRWIELLRQPGLLVYGMQDSRGEPAGVHCLVQVADSVSHEGNLGLDLRWQISRSSWYRSAMLANRPGSQVEDPAVLTGSEPLDGAWLAIEGSANRVVMANGLWGLQSPSGAWLSEPRWRAVEYDTDQTLRVVKADAQVGLMDMEGHMLVPPIYDTASACVPDSGGLVGYWVRVPPPLPEPLAPVGVGGELPARLGRRADSEQAYGYGLLGLEGEWIISPKYSYLGMPIPGSRHPGNVGGIFAYSGRLGRQGMFALDGSVLLPCDYARVCDIATDLWYVELWAFETQKWFYDGPDITYPTLIDTWTTTKPQSRIVRRVDGRLITVDLACESFLPIPDVGFLIIREGKMGLVDMAGREILPAEYPCLRAIDQGRYLLASTPIFADRVASRDVVGLLQAPVADPWQSRAEQLQGLNALPQVLFGPGVVYGHYRVFDTAARTWLPRALESVSESYAGRYARLSEARGWGLLEPDLQTVLDAEALALPGPLRRIEILMETYRSKHPRLYRRTTVASGTPLYRGMTDFGVGLFTADGRVFVPFICQSISPLDGRFLRLRIDSKDVLMDRAGRLIVAGGETTWAALGAPGFVPGQRGGPPAAGAAGEPPE